MGQPRFAFCLFGLQAYMKPIQNHCFMRAVRFCHSMFLLTFLSFPYYLPLEMHVNRTGGAEPIGAALRASLEVHVNRTGGADAGFSRTLSRILYCSKKAPSGFP